MNRAQRREHERAVARVMSNPVKVRAVQAQIRRESAARPMDSDQITDLAAYAHAAMHALTNGQATEHDIHSLAAIANITMLLCERGYGPEYLSDAKAGQAAVVALFERFSRTGKVGASGQELGDLNQMIDLHDQQLQLQPTRGEMTAVLAEIRRRQAQGDALEVVE